MPTNRTRSMFTPICRLSDPSTDSASFLSGWRLRRCPKHRMREGVTPLSSRLQRHNTMRLTNQRVEGDISSAMRYTVDPRVGPTDKQRSAKGRQPDRCYDQGQQTPPPTTATRLIQPVPTLVAAEQIASILIRFAEWLTETREGDPRRAH